MSEVNFEIKQESLAVVQNTVIEANFDEVKAALTEMVAPYKSLIVSEDGIASAKNDRARIRKVASRVDEMRKVVKKAYSEPLAVFEARCKELVAICNEGSDNLDVQIKNFEQKEANEKITSLRAEYDAYSGDEAKECLPWERLMNPKWSNKGYSVEDATQEIYNALSRTERDLAAIRSMGGDNVAYLLDTYRNTLDISEVIRKNAEINARKAIEEQRRREAEERRAAAEAEAQRRKALEVQPAPVVPATVEEPDDEKEELMTVVFKVSCTKAQLSALGQYLKANGIKYGRA